MTKIFSVEICVILFLAVVAWYISLALKIWQSVQMFGWAPPSIPKRDIFHPLLFLSAASFKRRPSFYLSWVHSAVKPRLDQILDIKLLQFFLSQILDIIFTIYRYDMICVSRINYETSFGAMKLFTVCKLLPCSPQRLNIVRMKNLLFTYSVFIIFHNLFSNILFFSFFWEDLKGITVWSKSNF